MNTLYFLQCVHELYVVNFNIRELAIMFILQAIDNSLH